ncbi:MAG: hypothetical protein ACE5H1_06045 [Thermodesulfobacteriota bacterium]
MIILIAPLTYFAGAYIFSRLVERIAKTGFLVHGNTMAEFVGKIYDSRIVSVLVAIVGLFGIVAILLIELFVGTEILGSFFKDGDKSFLLPFICVVVFFYVMGGGFSAVVKTDKVQLAFMYVFVFILLGWLFSKAERIVDISYFPHPLIDENRFLLPLALLINIFFVNLLLLPAQVRSWQMAAASKSAKDLKKGVIRGAYSTLFLWSAISIVGIS